MIDQRSKIFTFRANFEEVKTLEAKKKQLRSKAGLGTLAKNLALTRALPKNDNDIEFLSLMDFVFESLKKLGVRMEDEKIFNQLKNTYQLIVNEYEETLKKTINR
jgi:hypothetical protein